MLLNKDALQHLEKNEIVKAINETLAKNSTSVPLLVVPDDFHLKVLDQYMPNRAFYQFNYNTHSIDDFASYAEEFDQDGAKCFLDSENMRAKAIFDIGSEEAPLHQLHKAKIELNKTSAYSKLLSVSGQQYSQRDAAEFIEDWADFLVIATESGEALTAAQAAQALSKMTIDSARQLKSEVGNFSESMSAMERVDVANAERMPANITFTCTPYIGLDKREFVLRVSILTSGDKPKVVFRIVSLEIHKEDIANEFKDLLIAKFEKSKMQIFLGGTGRD